MFPAQLIVVVLASQAAAAAVFFSLLDERTPFSRQPPHLALLKLLSFPARSSSQKKIFDANSRCCSCPDSVAYFFMSPLIFSPPFCPLLSMLPKPNFGELAIRSPQVLLLLRALFSSHNSKVADVQNRFGSFHRYTRLHHSPPPSPFSLLHGSDDVSRHSYFGRV